MRSRTLSRPMSVTLAAAILTAGAACSPGTTDGESGDPNTLTVYSTLTPSAQARLAAAFEEKTGIKVKSVRVQSSQLTKRFDEEYKAKRPVADVLTMNEEQYVRQAAEQGIFEDISGLKGLDKVPADWRISQYTYISTLAPQKVAYSKAKVSGDLIPTSWDDLLKPEFKGKILFSDPRTNPELSAKALAALAEAKGEDFLKKLAGQDLKIVSSSTPGMEELAGGNGMLLAQSYDMNLLAYEDKGAPIGLTEAFAPVSGLEFYTQIPSNAPNMEGARKWVEFQFSQEGQQATNEGIGVSPLGDAVPGTLPMPAAIAEVDTEKAVENLPRYLDLLNIH